MNAKMDALSDAVVVQAQSTELQTNDCSPGADAIRYTERLFKTAKKAKKLLYETWSRFDYTDNKKKQENCMFAQLQCTYAGLATAVRAQIAPVGRAWQYLGNKHCDKTAHRGAAAPARSCLHVGTSPLLARRHGRTTIEGYSTAIKPTSRKRSVHGSMRWSCTAR